MSLTSLLADPKSRLSQFLAAELPDGRGFAAAFRAVRPADSEAIRPAVPTATRVPWGTLGAAIDHRFRNAFSDRGMPTAAVAIGMIDAAELATSEATRTAITAAARGLCEELRRFTTDERTADRSSPIMLKGDAEDRLCRLCFAMSWFEEVCRTGRLWPGTPLGDADGSLTLEQLLAAVPQFAVADLTAQVQLAEKPLRLLRATTPPDLVHLGPVFQGSGDVGGADADLILDTTLVEIKSTTTPSKRLCRKEFGQLISYVLLDYQNSYGIERVALYLTRFGRLYVWPVNEYLNLFGCRRPLDELRERCAALLRQSSSPE